jgi:hypothetical protein
VQWLQKTEAGEDDAVVILLTLQPGKTGCLPTSDGTSMALVVERSFKAAGDVVTGMVTHCCHGLSRGQTSASRAADDEEIIVWLDAKHLKLPRETLDEAWIDGLIGKGLPLDQDRPLV